jgi:hypothetical protein
MSILLFDALLAKVLAMDEVDDAILLAARGALFARAMVGELHHPRPRPPGTKHVMR